MTNIDKYTPQLPEITQYLLDNGVEDLRNGDIFINVDGSYKCEILKIVNVVPCEHYKFKVEYLEATNWEATEWGEVKSYNVRDFIQYHIGTRHSKKLERGVDLQQYLKEARDLIEGKTDISIYQDDSSDVVNSETALVAKNSKENLQMLQQQIEDKKNKAEIVRAFVSYEMEKKRRELEKVREKLNGVLAVFQKKIKKIMKVITTIELYLGINEELFQIQDGEKASVEEPIQFRQMIYFMDEEIGHWENGGLDYTNIDWFDKWLCEDDNYKALVPEKKGVIVFKPRRKNKEYKSGDPATDAERNRWNKLTYILIRNGECLYRIYTDNISIYPRLFPKRKDFQELLEKLSGEYKSKDGWHYDAERSREEAENEIYYYKKSAILMQGLIDRSDVFLPMKKNVSMFNIDESEGLIKFIYDDEATLPSGRLPFKEWKRKINSKIGVGSRVICTGTYSRRDYGDRFYGVLKSSRYTDDYGKVDTPDEGCYQIHGFKVKKIDTMRQDEWREMKSKLDSDGTEYEMKLSTISRYKPTPDKHGCYSWSSLCLGSNAEQKSLGVADSEGYLPACIVATTFEDLTVLYNPGDKVYPGWGSFEWEPHERKRRVRFRINKEDDQILNYDQISLDDIDYYLASRTDRPNYLHMLPLLEKMRTWRLAEIKKETHFKRFIFERALHSDLGEEISAVEIMKRVNESVEYWKYKNKWKRPIDKDDTLAMRMIEARINSKNYDKLKRLK